MTDNSCCGTENGKQLSAAWKLTALRGCPFLQEYMHQSGQRALTLQVTQTTSSTAAEAAEAVLAGPVKCKSMLLTLLSIYFSYSKED